MHRQQKKKKLESVPWSCCKSSSEIWPLPVPKLNGGGPDSAMLHPAVSHWLVLLWQLAIYPYGQPAYHYKRWETCGILRVISHHNNLLSMNQYGYHLLVMPSRCGVYHSYIFQFHHQPPLFTAHGFRQGCITLRVTLPRKAADSAFPKAPLKKAVKTLKKARSFATNLPIIITTMDHWLFSIMTPTCVTISKYDWPSSATIMNQSVVIAGYTFVKGDPHSQSTTFHK